MSEVLLATASLIDTNAYYAWDPLAAMALVDPSIVEAKGAILQVITTGKEIGQTKLMKWDSGSHLKVANNAKAARFASLFDRAFTV